MYTISEPSGVIRNDGVIVVQDDTKPEYQAYVRFLQAGGAPVQIKDEVNPPRKPHATCTPRQFRRALNARGLRDMVEQYVAGSDKDTQDDYEFAQRWESDHPLLLTAAQSLGMTEDDLHDLISHAATL